MSSNKSVDCYDCKYSVKLNDEEWEEWEKQEGGRRVLCSKCKYKDSINNVNRHFIIDIIKITKCFVSYKLKEIYINGYHNDDTVHKRKIQTQARYVPQIAYPKNFDVRHETIKINELWRITE